MLCSAIARRYDHVIFTCIIHRRNFLRPANQFVGFARHRGHDNSNLIAGIDLGFHPARDILDFLDIGDRSAAKFHDNTGHEVSPLCSPSIGCPNVTACDPVPARVSMPNLRRFP